MLETFFVWGFIVLPLVSAVLLMLYRARFFLLGVAGMALAIALVWGVLSLGDNLGRWWSGAPSPQPEAECVEGRAADGSCTL